MEKGQTTQTTHLDLRHVLLLLLLVVVLVALLLLVVVGALRLALRLLLRLLGRLFPLLLRLQARQRLLGVRDVVRDEDVVEYRARLDLPQVEADAADLLLLVQLGIGLVFGIVDLRVDPGALVGGVVDLLGLPLALKGDYVIMKGIEMEKKNMANM